MHSCLRLETYLELVYQKDVTNGLVPRLRVRFLLTPENHDVAWISEPHAIFERLAPGRRSFATFGFGLWGCYAGQRVLHVVLLRCAGSAAAFADELCEK